MTRRLKYWGWGYEDEALDAREQRRLTGALGGFLDVQPQDLYPPKPVEDLRLPPSRIAPDPEIAPFCSSSSYDRASHAYGKSYRDIVRARRGEFPYPPDFVAYPSDTGQLARVLAYCDARRAAAIPFGGGTSVVGGVEPDLPSGYNGAVSVDLKGLNRVLEVDPVTLAARAEGGILGPDFERALRPHGLTMRHYPQSFYFSTLGGWIVTRGGGHYSTLYGKIDEMVQSVGVLSPAGLNRSIEHTRRLPSSSVGPDPNRLWIGSEGILGIVTDAWMRVHRIPKFRANATIVFESFLSAMSALRQIAQANLYPATCRVLDPFESMVSAAFGGSMATGGSTLILGFESADHPVEPWLGLALEICRDHGGTASPATGGARADGGAVQDEGTDATNAWKQTFFRQPYVRDVLVGMGVVADTFETAMTWDRIDSFYETVRAQTLEAVHAVCGGGGVLARTTHLYRDGASLYFSFYGKARPGAELEQWSAIKQAASDAILAAGGTISHHHACGRDHRTWAAQELPEHWIGALRAAKKHLDPAGIMNPGAVIAGSK